MLAFVVDPETEEGPAGEAIELVDEGMAPAGLSRRRESDIVPSLFYLVALDGTEGGGLACIGVDRGNWR